MPSKDKMFVGILFVAALLWVLVFLFNIFSFLEEKHVLEPEAQGGTFVTSTVSEDVVFDSTSTIVFSTLAVPSEVRAIYLTAAAISYSRLFLPAMEFARDAKFNAVVINVKDGYGASVEKVMMSVLVKQVRDLGFYPIARLVVFQDDYLPSLKPETALRRNDGSAWKDPGGYGWVDPASREVWDYNLQIAEEAYRMGFAEINLDYVRFPSDGDREFAIYPVYKGESKEEVVNSFFQYFTSKMREKYPNVRLSVDLFAHSFLKDNDLGVGHRLTVAARYFDVISPMIYPSHYAKGNFGYANPAEHPYDVARKTLESGLQILSSSTQSHVVIRPWIQDFDMGAVYDRPMIQAQIQAVKDVGLKNGFMVWNPANVYKLEEFVGD